MNGSKRFVPLRRTTRQRISPGWFASSLILVLTLLAGCVSIQPAASNLGAPAAITLRFAVSDGEGHPQIDNYVLEFVDQVQALSNGNITIELVWDAGGGTFDGYEKGTLQRVLQGKYDLGLVASRTWDSEAITNFQALHAPFLITNNALAEAVASGAIGQRMLDSLSAVGLVGLTLWPEDLRHPFSVVPDKPLLAPQDFAGLHIRTPLSDVSYQLIDVLGAMPMTGDGGYEGAESGLLQGGTLTGRPIATGNVTFYSKFQVIFANADAFNRLNDAQRAVLRQAAAATQSKAITEHRQEVDAATAYCADGGTIVLASAEQVTAFEQAAQPVFDNLAQDPLNAEMIAAIRELKASTTPSAGAAACAPEATAPSPAPEAETQTWSAGLPPNGVWQISETVDELVQLGMLRSTAAEWAGTYTFTFQDGKFREQFVGEQGESGDCLATYEVVEDFVRITRTPITANCPPAVDDIQWRLDEGGLHLHLVAVQGGPSLERRISLEAKPWQQVEAWSPGLPPNGVWQVTLTSDELVQLGMLRSTAAEWAGVSTITFQDGKQIGQWVGEQGQTGECTATYEVVEDFVRITRTPITADCPPEVQDIQWRLDEDGLHLHLVAFSGQFFEDKIATEAKPWQQVEAWSPGLPPNGVWQVELTAEDFVKMGTLNSVGDSSAGVYTWTFQDGSTEFTIRGPALNVACVGAATVVGDAVRLHWDGSNGCDAAAYDAVQWRLEPEGLHFQLVGSNLGIDAQLKATYETKPWQKVVEAWSPGLPPNGVWQVTETVDDFVRMGLLRSVAESDWAGVTTLTLQDGKSLEVWQGESGKSGKCVATYEVVGEVVRFTYFGKSDECPGRVDDMQWRVDDQGLLHLHLVSTKNAPFIEIRSYLEAKPWQKVK